MKSAASWESKSVKYESLGALEKFGISDGWRGFLGSFLLRLNG